MCRIRDKRKDRNWQTIWVLLLVIRRTNEMNQNLSCLVNRNRRKYRVYLIVCLDLSNFPVSVNGLPTQGTGCLRYISFLKCHQAHCLTLVSLLTDDSVLLRQVPPFRIVLHFKELRLFTENWSCRLDIIADLHQQC